MKESKGVRDGEPCVLTHDLNHLYRVLTAYGDEVGSCGVSGGTEDMDLSGMVEMEVHVQLLMSPSPPNPWLLLGLSLSSFAVFFVVVKRREQTNPASHQPRQADHPLVPPRHKEPNSNN